MQRKKWHTYCFGLLISTLCVACSKVPSGILSEKKMQAVQLDMQLAESMISVHSKEYTNSEEKEVLFKSVFRKHGITEAQYDSSLIWYGKNLDIYMKIYDRMLAELNKRQKALGDVQAEAAPVTRQDSVDIWPRLSAMALTPEALFNGVVFDINPETNYPSGSSFVLDMNVWGINDSMTSFPEVRLFADQGDTLITVSDQIRKDGPFQAILQSLPTKQVKRVFGQITLLGSDSTYHKIYLDDIQLMRYNYGKGIETTAAPAEESSN